MSKLSTYPANPGAIHDVIKQFGAKAVLYAALKALLKGGERKAKPARADLSKLDDWLRRDLGLPPSDASSRYPYRSP